MSAAALQLPARAKLNLVLRVVGRRADGYHLLETLFHALALHDDVVVALAPSGCELHGSADEPSLRVGTGPENLVVRALQAFAACTGYRGGFRARLHKRIPAGGGLGGGSSDAAAALRLANALLGRPLDQAALAALAVRLGADVPFCLRGGSQWGRGIGDQLSPASVPPQHFVLLLPPFGCATAAVYETYAALWQDGRAAATVSPFPVLDHSHAALRIVCHNDLLPAAERVRPELAVLRQRAIELIGPVTGVDGVHMTGSGSTLFVPCLDAAVAVACAAALQPLAADGVRCLITRSAVGDDEPRPPDEARGGAGAA